MPARQRVERGLQVGHRDEGVEPGRIGVGRDDVAGRAVVEQRQVHAEVVLPRQHFAPAAGVSRGGAQRRDAVRVGIDADDERMVSCERAPGGILCRGSRGLGRLDHSLLPAARLLPGAARGERLWVDGRA